MNFLKDDKNHVILSPLTPPEVKKSLESYINDTLSLKSHILLATSGTSQKKTSSTIKSAVLKKEAILLSAKTVNDFIGSNSKDCWLSCLPRHHIASLGIYARALLSGSKVIDIYSYKSKWSQLRFLDAIDSHNVTLSSLVPTQVYDLVKNKVQAPSSLKCLFVGGGALSETLFFEARRLGWPLFVSYGMTETASQIATSHYEALSFLEGAPYLKILNHVSLRDENNRLKIKSKSLLSYYVFLNQNICTHTSPVEDGFFKTEDSVDLKKKGYLRFLNREGDEIKISGERVSLRELKKVFMEEKLKLKFPDTVSLYPYKTKREGMVMSLLVPQKDISTLSEDDLKSVIKNFNMKVMPYEKIRRLLYVKDKVYTELFKLKQTIGENDILENRELKVKKRIDYEKA